MGSIFTDQLEDLIRSGAVAASPEAKIALSRLHGEIKHRLDKGSSAREFFTESAQSLIRIKGKSHAEVRLQCLLDCAKFFYLNGHSTDALQAAQHFDKLASQLGSKTEIRRAKTFLGVIFADLGNVAAAVPMHCLSFELGRELADPLAQTVSLMNLGVALNYAGLYREAIPCFRQAAAIASSANTLLDLQNTSLTNLAQSYLYLEEYESGFAMIAQAIAQSSEPKDAHAVSSRTIREYTYVQLALELGRLTLAREHAGDCARFARTSGMNRSKSLADIALALCEIHGGDVQKGITVLENTLSQCGETAVKEATLGALVKAHDQAEQPERALEYLELLIDHLRVNRAKSVAALLAAAPGHSSTPAISAEHADFRGFILREAKLKAKVAKRQAASSQVEMLERLAVTAMLRDDASGEHGARVGRLAGLFAAELDLDPASTHALELGARLHDIGKIGVPDRILLSVKDLQDVERHFICAHTILGAELLGKGNFPHVRVAEEVARHHHEWWNGSGYPTKLVGKRIPLPARIVAIVDVFDALTHGRPYSEPWAIERALLEIANRRGTQFDPELTEVFLKLMERLEAEHADLTAFLGATDNNSPFAQARARIRRVLSAERAELGKQGLSSTSSSAFSQ